MSLFQRRHYEWLAAFAGETLDEQQRGLLATELARDNPRFDVDRFLSFANKIEARYGAALRERIKRTLTSARAS